MDHDGCGREQIPDGTGVTVGVEMPRRLEMFLVRCCPCALPFVKEDWKKLAFEFAALMVKTHLHGNQVPLGGS